MCESYLEKKSDNRKQANLCKVGIPEGEEREKGFENVFEEIVAENFPNLKKEIEAQRAPEGKPKQTYTKTYYNKNSKS